MALVRLQKILAEAGIASRRAAERYILEGRVSVNGQVVRELGAKADPIADRVIVEGRPVRARRKLHVALHKPRGYLCSRRADAGQPLAGDLLPKEWANLYPVGRLDLDSEGLLLFTNDGDFCLRLTHPRFGVPKRYIATVEGRVTGFHLEALKRGIQESGDWLKVAHARILSANQSHSVVGVELTEGKNREVRRLFEAQSLHVVRLLRVAIGPLKLGDMPEGRWRVLGDAEIASLLRCAEGPAGRPARLASLDKDPEGSPPADPSRTRP